MKSSKRRTSTALPRKVRCSRTPWCLRLRARLAEVRFSRAVLLANGLGAILQGAVWDEAIATFPLELEAKGGYFVGYQYKVWSPGRTLNAPIGAAILLLVGSDQHASHLGAWLRQGVVGNRSRRLEGSAAGLSAGRPRDPGRCCRLFGRVPGRGQGVGNTARGTCRGGRTGQHTAGGQRRPRHLRVCRARSATCTTSAAKSPWRCAGRDRSLLAAWWMTS